MAARGVLPLFITRDPAVTPTDASFLAASATAAVGLPTQGCPVAECAVGCTSGRARLAAMKACTDAVTAIVARCERAGLPFFDTSFTFSRKANLYPVGTPPDSSVGEPHRLARLSAAFPARPFSASAPHKLRVKQGSVGDAYFLSAVGAIAANATGVRPMLGPLLPAFSERWGVYGAVLFIRGRWTWVVVDDVVPVGSDGSPLFCDCETELWPMVLEKAMAKAMGSWDAIDGGLEAEALTALTGGSQSCFAVAACPNPRALGLALQAGRDPAAVVAVAVTSEGASEAKGLIPGHGYTLLGVHECADGTAFVRLTNHVQVAAATPGSWLDGLWHGPFAPASPEWRTAPCASAELDADLITGNSNVERTGDDAAFWMRFEDFASNFAEVARVLLPTAPVAASASAIGAYFEATPTVVSRTPLRMSAPMHVMLTIGAADVQDEAGGPHHPTATVSLAMTVVVVEPREHERLKAFDPPTLRLLVAQIAPTDEVADTPGGLDGAAFIAATEQRAPLRWSMTTSLGSRDAVLTVAALPAGSYLCAVSVEGGPGAAEAEYPQVTAIDLNTDAFHEGPALTASISCPQHTHAITIRNVDPAPETRAVAQDTRPLYPIPSSLRNIIDASAAPLSGWPAASSTSDVTDAPPEAGFAAARKACESAVASIVAACENASIPFCDRAGMALLTGAASVARMRSVHVSAELLPLPAQVADLEDDDGRRGTRTPTSVPRIFRGRNIADAASSALPSCLAAVASHTDTKRACVEGCIPAFSERWGVYGAVLFIRGRWTWVVVDDVVPVGSDGSPLFCDCETELWPLVLEKAMAKAMGSWDAMAATSAQHVLMAVLGTIALARPPALRTRSNADEASALHQQGFLVLARAVAPSGDLTVGGLYGVLDVKSAPDGRGFICVRAPPVAKSLGLRAGCWSGAYSASSSAWSENPTHYRAVQPDFLDPLVSWIADSDFTATFGELVIAANPKDFTTSLGPALTERSESADGTSTSWAATLTLNHQAHTVALDAAQATSDRIEDSRILIAVCCGPDIAPDATPPENESDTEPEAADAVAAAAAAAAGDEELALDAKPALGCSILSTDDARAVAEEAPAVWGSGASRWKRASQPEHSDFTEGAVFVTPGIEAVLLSASVRAGLVVRLPTAGIPSAASAAVRCLICLRRGAGTLRVSPHPNGIATTAAPAGGAVPRAPRSRRPSFAQYQRPAPEDGDADDAGLVIGFTNSTTSFARAAPAAFQHADPFGRSRADRQMAEHGFAHLLLQTDLAATFRRQLDIQAGPDGVIDARVFVAAAREALEAPLRS